LVAWRFELYECDLVVFVVSFKCTLNKHIVQIRYKFNINQRCHMPTREHYHMPSIFCGFNKTQDVDQCSQTFEHTLNCSWPINTYTLLQPKQGQQTLFSMHCKCPIHLLNTNTGTVTSIFLQQFVQLLAYGIKYLPCVALLLKWQTFCYLAIYEKFHCGCYLQCYYY